MPRQLVAVLIDCEGFDLRPSQIDPNPHSVRIVRTQISLSPQHVLVFLLNSGRSAILPRLAGY
jgi:hypothetical protein